MSLLEGNAEIEKKKETVNEARAPTPYIPSLPMEILMLLSKIAAVLIITLLLFTFMFGVARNSEGEMNPIIKDGDMVLFYRLDKSYVVTDTLALKYEDKVQIRRVVATAGDTIDITKDGLIINGAIQQEPNIFYPTERYVDGISFPVTIEEGQVFVLGDSRENSTDSRVYGPVDTDSTMGQVITVIKRRNI